MIVERIPEIQKLTPREKLILATELTDEYQAAPEPDDRMKGAILELVAQRMEHFSANPDSAATLKSFRCKANQLRSGG